MSALDMPVATRATISRSRSVSTSATIMICVFVTFSLMDNRSVAEFGIGLAVAVTLDAFILRTVLVPAVMHLSGDANWLLPRWLDRRLPHLAVEPAAKTPAPPAPITLARDPHPKV